MKYSEPCERCWCGASALVSDYINNATGQEGFIVKCQRRHFGGFSKTISGAIASWDLIIKKRRIRMDRPK